MDKISELIKINKLEKVLKNFFSLSVLQIVNYIFPLVTIPYITKVIGLGNFGTLAFALSICNYFLILVDYGFNLTAVKDISQNRDNKNEMSLIFSKVFFSKLLLLLCSMLIFLVIVLSASILRDNYIVYLFSFMIVINNLIYPQWFFQGIEKMEFITILNVIVQLVYLVCIFSFINEKSDYIYIPLFMGGSTFLIGLISMRIIYKKYNIRFTKICFKDIVDTIKSGRYIFVNQLMPNLYKNSATFLLGIFAPINSVGLFSAADRVSNAVIPLIRILSRSFFPHLARSHNQTFKTYRKIILGSSLFITLLIGLTADYIFYILYAPEFHAGINLVYIMSSGIFFLGLYDCYGTNGLIHIGKEKLLMKNTIRASIIGFIISISLIFLFQEYGAAIGVVTGRFLMGVGALYFYRKSTL